MTQKKEFTITGMHCNSCALVIKTTLEDKEGVASVSVSYDSKKAVLEFDDQKTSIDDIKSEIESLGYKAT